MTTPSPPAVQAIRPERDLSTTEPARAIVARNDAAEQDRVAPYRP